MVHAHAQCVYGQKLGVAYPVRKGVAVGIGLQQRPIGIGITVTRSADKRKRGKSVMRSAHADKETTAVGTLAVLNVLGMVVFVEPRQ